MFGTLRGFRVHITKVHNYSSDEEDIDSSSAEYDGEEENDEKSDTCNIEDEECDKRENEDYEKNRKNSFAANLVRLRLKAKDW